MIAMKPKRKLRKPLKVSVFVQPELVSAIMKNSELKHYNSQEVINAVVQTAIQDLVFYSRISDIERFL